MKNNLIGISGKIGSGKDTVGRVLQILNKMPHFNNNGILSFLDRPINSDYKVKKYADKLKEIVCLLIGCTREQLEDREFKEKELGEEWWYWKVWSPLYFKLDFKLFPYNTEKEVRRNFKKVKDLEITLIKLTPRKLLQLLGTECGRQILHPNIWVNALFADYKSLGIKTKYVNANNNFTDLGISKDSDIPIAYQDYPKWIITDVRFPNEAQAIKDRGGIVIRVNRLDVDKFTTNFPQTLHPSETALDEYEFDHVIENSGSLEELVEKVKQLKLV